MKDTYLDIYLDMTGIAKVTEEKCQNITQMLFILDENSWTPTKSQ